MKKQILYIATAILFGTLFFTCARDIDAPQKNDAKTEKTEWPLTLDDARVFFADFEDQLFSTAADRGRTDASSQDLPLPVPDWERAVYSELLGVYLVEVPFSNYGFNIVSEPLNANPEDDPLQDEPQPPANEPGSALDGGTPGDPQGGDPDDPGGANPPGQGSAGETPFQGEPNTTGLLLAGVDSFGEIWYCVLYITPEPEWASRKGIEPMEMKILDLGNDFSGVIRYYALDGTFRAGNVYENGTPVSGCEPTRRRANHPSKG